MKTTYTLIIFNDQGASRETKHATKSDVRRQIRTWSGKMTARVYAGEGALIYEGPSKSF